MRDDAIVHARVGEETKLYTAVIIEVTGMRSSDATQILLNMVVESSELPLKPMRPMSKSIRTI